MNEWDLGRPGSGIGWVDRVDAKGLDHGLDVAEGLLSRGGGVDRDVGDVGLGVERGMEGAVVRGVVGGGLERGAEGLGGAQWHASHGRRMHAQAGRL